MFVRVHHVGTLSFLFVSFRKLCVGKACSVNRIPWKTHQINSAWHDILLLANAQHSALSTHIQYQSPLVNLGWPYNRLQRLHAVPQSCYNMKRINIMPTLRSIVWMNTHFKVHYDIIIPIVQVTRRRNVKVPYWVTSLVTYELLIFTIEHDYLVNPWCSYRSQFQLSHENQIVC